jgi:hypothetical protein
VNDTGTECRRPVIPQSPLLVDIYQLRLRTGSGISSSDKKQAEEAHPPVGTSGRSPGGSMDDDRVRTVDARMEEVHPGALDLQPWLCMLDRSFAPGSACLRQNQPRPKSSRRRSSEEFPLAAGGSLLRRSSNDSNLGLVGEVLGFLVRRTSGLSRPVVLGCFSVSLSCWVASVRLPFLLGHRFLHLLMFFAWSCSPSRSEGR